MAARSLGAWRVSSSCACGPPVWAGMISRRSFTRPIQRERVAELPAWILGHLHERMTVDTLAERTCLCPRHFSRLFKQIFECTPADFVEELRLSEARRRLLGLRTTVESVAESVGFKSSDAFRRAFERRVGVTPTAFRRHAASAPPAKVVRPHRAGDAGTPDCL